MKQLFLTILSVIVISALIAVFFAFRQADQERTRLVSDLEFRTRLLSESLQESIEPSYLTNAQRTLQKTVDRFSDRERLVGIVVYDNKNAIIASSQNLPKEHIENLDLVANAMDANKEANMFAEWWEENFYLFANPIHQDWSVVGALLVIQKAQYIDVRIAEIWKNNFFRLSVQALAFSLAVAVIIYFIMFRPLIHFVHYVRSIRSGNTTAPMGQNYALFQPLSRELTSMTQSLNQARTAASFEARMRLEKLDTPWTAERLREFIKSYIGHGQLYVVSNREPYVHGKTKSGITYQIPAGGVITAFNSVMEASGGMWIAHGSGSADRETVDKDDYIRVPPNEPKYTLKRVWLNNDDIKGYYQWFSNEALWPLFHNVHVRPVFRKEDWGRYRRVNTQFAKKLLEELRGEKNPIVLIQDYHLALLPAIIKKTRPDVKIGLFWHIPWTSPESFSICPQKKEILAGMLGADVIGFHTQQYGNNFMDTVSRELEARVDFDQFSVVHKEHMSFVKPFPISVGFAWENTDPLTQDKISAIREKFHIHTKYFALGVDRMDYTKGLLERFKAIEFFLDGHEEYIGNFTLVQIASPSRETVPYYQQFAADVNSEADRINQKFGKNKWKPIVLLHEHFAHEDIDPLYAIADICMVTSLHDGMNLVAKEFIAAQSDQRGMLILSQFTGAAKELKDALIVNPYSAEETSAAIYQALNMPQEERSMRMERMRKIVMNYNVYRWSAEFIKSIVDIV